MSIRLQSVAVITKAAHAGAAALGRDIAAWLSDKGVACQALEHDPEGDFLRHLTPADLAMVLGGDGTLLSVARALAGGPPLVGLNMGRLGYLAEVTPDNWRRFLSDVMERGLSVSERLALAWSVHRGGEVVARGRAVNDVVVNRGSLARLISLTLTVDGQPLGGVRADGLVTATPTGSTAYSVSAGGPVVHPEMDAFTVTAICPFFQDFRPLVLPGAAVLEIGVPEPSADVHLTLDGQTGVSLRVDDVVRIRRDQPPTLLARTGPWGLLPKLRTTA